MRNHVIDTRATSLAGRRGDGARHGASAERVGLRRSVHGIRSQQTQTGKGKPASTVQLAQSGAVMTDASDTTVGMIIDKWYEPRAARSVARNLVFDGR